MHGTANVFTYRQEHRTHCVSSVTSNACGRSDPKGARLTVPDSLVVSQLPRACGRQTSLCTSATFHLYFADLETEKKTIEGGWTPIIRLLQTAL